MDKLVKLRMQQHELTMRQMVTEILLGKLNIDQAAVCFNVSRQTVLNWVKKVEEEAEATQQTAPISPDLPPPRKTTATRRSAQHREDQVNQLRAKVHTLEQELEAANFKALYYSTLVQIAKKELGVDIEKKSVTAPAARQAIRFMLLNYPNIQIRQLEGAPHRRSDWFYPTGLLSILATTSGAGQ